MAFLSIRKMAVCATLASLMLSGAALVQPAVAQTTGFTQALAVVAARNDAVAAFYRTNSYATLWTGPEDVARRQALLSALDGAGAHGLPVARYDAAQLRARFRAAVTEGDRGRLEVAMTEAYLAYARDISSGVLNPKALKDGIEREVVRPDAAVLLAQIRGYDPRAVLAGLAPNSPDYLRLMKEKLRLDRLTAADWGPVITAKTLKPGAEGAQVVALRDRLTALGYLGRSATTTYDSDIEAAVLQFQSDQGLIGDGVAGPNTIASLNADPADRLKSVIVALERLRWMGNAPRGDRYIWVNMPDYSAQIIDNGQVTFKTRAVIGMNEPDRRSPEFSDVMEHMVINPSWSVPRSITTKQYLPMLRANRNAVSYMQVIDGSGRVVPRSAVNFAAYSGRDFPYTLRQPPSDKNALGLVKFMFPNPYSIYLHDTPAKELFDSEDRAYSYGCIRLAEPFDFAYALLSRQVDDPEASFAADLATGKETTVKLVKPLPVHLVYFTAWPNARGKISYPRDIYGRDGRIFDALTEAGVVLTGVQG